MPDPLSGNALLSQPLRQHTAAQISRVNGLRYREIARKDLCHAQRGVTRSKREFCTLTTNRTILLRTFPPGNAVKRPKTGASRVY